MTEAVGVATAQENQGLHATNKDVVLGDPRAAETIWASGALPLGRNKPVWVKLVRLCSGGKGHLHP